MAILVVQYHRYCSLSHGISSQQLNIVNTIWITAFETISFGLFCYATKQKGLESTPLIMSQNASMGHLCIHSLLFTYCLLVYNKVTQITTYVSLYSVRNLTVLPRQRQPTEVTKLLQLQQKYCNRHSYKTKHTRSWQIQLKWLSEWELHM